MREPLTPAEKETLNDFAEVLGKIDAQFWCGGTIQFEEERLGLFYKAEGGDAK
jgi:hypothetical protein